MFRPQRFFVDRQCAAVEGFRFGVPRLLLEKSGQIIQVRSNRKTLPGSRFFVNGEAAPVSGFRQRISSLGGLERAQVIQIDRHCRMFLA
jgi:hypothetical protein